jgi:hypothetical protein
MFVKHLSRKNIMIFFNIIVLSKNFKNTLHPNTYKVFQTMVFGMYKKLVIAMKTLGWS